MHFSINMTIPHKSAAPFMGKRVSGQFSFTHPTTLLCRYFFCSRPNLHAARTRKKVFEREHLLRRLSKDPLTVFSKKVDIV